MSDTIANLKMTVNEHKISTKASSRTLSRTKEELETEWQGKVAAAEARGTAAEEEKDVALEEVTAALVDLKMRRDHIAHKALWFILHYAADARRCEAGEVHEARRVFFEGVPTAFPVTEDQRAYLAGMVRGVGPISKEPAHWLRSQLALHALAAACGELTRRAAQEHAGWFQPVRGRLHPAPIDSSFCCISCT